MKRGDMRRSYTVRCALCDEVQTFYMQYGVSITKPEAEEAARSRGWAKTGAYGWVHKQCKANKRLVRHRNSIEAT